jgi:hypothetical protein
MKAEFKMNKHLQFQKYLNRVAKTDHTQGLLHALLLISFRVSYLYFDLKCFRSIFTTGCFVFFQFSPKFTISYGMVNTP